MSTCSIFYTSNKILYLQSESINIETLQQPKFQYISTLHISHNSI